MSNTKDNELSGTWLGAETRAFGEPSVDLNSDVGESFGRWSLGDDAAMFRSVTSANIACGFHAGDPLGIQSTSAQAVADQVSIGAHVGYRDLAGFGRRFLDIAPSELRAEIIYQIGALQALAASVNGQVRYVKPHGGLYNAIVSHEGQADAVVDALAALDPPLPILGLPGSAVLRSAQRSGVPVFTEGFADRAYNPDGTLVSRSVPGSVLEDVNEISERVLGMVLDHQVRAIDGSLIDIEVQSICVHGDSPGAVDMAAQIRTVLAQAGVRVQAFA